MDFPVTILRPNCPAIFAAAPPATPAYVYRGSDSYDGNPAVHSASIDIGTASADRLVIVGVAFRNGSTPAPTSVTVNGVSLTQDIFSNTNQTVGIYSGLVAAGSGAQAVVVNWSVGAFTPKFLSVWTATGLASNVVKQTASFTDANAGAQVSVNIAVDAGDFMFAINSGTGTVPFTFAPSAVAPNADHAETINAGIMNSADWAILSTNAAFNVTCGDVTFSGDAAAATYR